MRRYVIVGAIAEVVCFASLWLYVVILQCGVHQKMVQGILNGIPLSPQIKNLTLFHYGCFHAAQQLDFIDNSFLFLAVLPTTTVLSLWTFDRQRKQKSA